MNPQALPCKLQRMQKINNQPDDIHFQEVSQDHSGTIVQPINKCVYIL